MRKAHEQIRVLFCSGMGVLVFGIIIAVTTNPSARPDGFGGTEQSGSESTHVFGMLLGGLGYTLALPAIVAWGVQLGMRATRE